MALLKPMFETEFKQILVVLSCILHTASLAQGDVLPMPSVRKTWGGKETNQGKTASWSSFQEWYEALDDAEEISRAVKNRAKL